MITHDVMSWVISDFVTDILLQQIVYFMIKEQSAWFPKLTENLLCRNNLWWSSLSDASTINSLSAFGAHLASLKLKQMIQITAKPVISLKKFQVFLNFLARLRLAMHCMLHGPSYCITKQWPSLDALRLVISDGAVFAPTPLLLTCPDVVCPSDGNC